MTLSPAEIEQIIIQEIPDARVRISDLRGDGAHYAAYIKSSVFKDKSRVEQHRMIYKALEPKMPDDLETLAIQTVALDE